MDLAANHYRQLKQLAQLVDDPEVRARRLRIASAILLIVLGIASIAGSSWLVVADMLPSIAVVLGGVAGAALAAGVIALLGPADD